MVQKRWLPEKAIIKLIVTLVVFIMLILFAIQNFQKHSTIRFLFWEIGETPISIIIFVSVLAGAVVATLALFPHIMRLRRRAREAEAEASRLKASVVEKASDS